MENTLLVGLSRQVALRRELDVIANNVANLSTNGFKGRSASFNEYLMPVARGDAFPRLDRRIAYVAEGEQGLDLGQGITERTGNPLDVAIRGNGFFAVQTPRGERLTRNGAFEIDGTGRLVTSDGHPVLGDGGPITFGPEETGVQISADGLISTSAGQKGKLRLVTVRDAKTIGNDGANLFSAPAGQVQAAPNTTRIEAGALERSNVRSVVEMTRLIEVSRAYTNITQMLQRADELRRTAIERLGTVPTSG